MSDGMGRPGAGPPPPADRDTRPVVALPRQGLPGAAIAVIAILLALTLFAVLDARRQRRVPANPQATTANAFASPPPLTVPPEPSQAPRTIYEVEPAPTRPAPSRLPVYRQPAFEPYSSPPVVQLEAAPPLEPSEQVGPRLPRAAAPALIIDEDLGESETSRDTAASPGAPRPGTPTPSAAPAVSDTPVRATTMRNRTNVMVIGTLIPGVLETPIDTARPGLVRAVVSQDARGFDGRRVLVPRGSRLIGEYQADVRSGQNRVLVTWTRLIRPDGVAISLGSPAADRLGGAGVPGRVNSFFFQRFAGAVLQSALTVGVNLASRPGNGSVIVGLPTGSITNVVGEELVPNDLRPKITVKRGVALNVFVARDLDFSGTPAVPQ